MGSTIPVRVEIELFEAAKSVGTVTGRSAAQQLNHWARVGRELENAQLTSHGDIHRVLAGEPGLTYDELNRSDQAVVRAQWEEAMVDRRSTLNYAERFSDSGSSWSEAEQHGNVTTHPEADLPR